MDYLYTFRSKMNDHTSITPHTAPPIYVQNDNYFYRTYNYIMSHLYKNTGAAKIILPSLCCDLWTYLLIGTNTRVGLR